VRLISRKAKIEKQLAKKGKKQRHVFLSLITFDQSQEGCAEVFTSFQLNSYLSNYADIKNRFAQAVEEKNRQIGSWRKAAREVIVDDECMDG